MQDGKQLRVSVLDVAFQTYDSWPTTNIKTLLQPYIYTWAPPDIMSYNNGTTSGKKVRPLTLYGDLYLWPQWRQSFAPAIQSSRTWFICLKYLKLENYTGSLGDQRAPHKWIHVDLPYPILRLGVWSGTQRACPILFNNILT